MRDAKENLASLGLLRTADDAADEALLNADHLSQLHDAQAPPALVASTRSTRYVPPHLLALRACGWCRVDPTWPRRAGSRAYDGHDRARARGRSRAGESSPPHP